MLKGSLRGTALHGDRWAGTTYTTSGVWRASTENYSREDTFGGSTIHRAMTGSLGGMARHGNPSGRGPTGPPCRLPNLVSISTSVDSSARPEAMGPSE